ncbi:MAG: ABC transporter ATP-binding protein [Thermoleophilaceae bacterium]
MEDPAIVVRDLEKSYGSTPAVRGLSLEVARGEIFGLLGPNGAGKTTTVEILEGHLRRSGGEVLVLGEDPERAGQRLRRRIGIVLQDGGFYPRVSVREALEHVAGIYPSPRDVAETIALVGLEEEAEVRVRVLSGGQRRRLDLALALVGDPELVFLDEPTTGFDPAARRLAWDAVRALRGSGTTVFLTTHYLEEAQALADRVAIVKDGRVVAEGPPSSLGGSDQAARYRVAYEEDGRVHEHLTDDPTGLLHRLTSEAIAAGRRLEGLSVTRPSLEDVYLELTAGQTGDGDGTPAEEALRR